MRFTRVVPLLPLASALVITDAEVFQNIEKSGKSIIDNAQNVLDGAFGKIDQTYEKVKDNAKEWYTKIDDTGADVQSWIEESIDDGMAAFEEDQDHPHHPPHDKPPHHGPPHRGPPHHGRPHHPPHDDKPNRTVYEVCDYTFRLGLDTNVYSSSTRASILPSLQSSLTSTMTSSRH